MSAPLEREASIFNEARHLPADRRARYLDEACGGDRALRRRVEELLADDAAAGNFLSAPAPTLERPDLEKTVPILIPSEKAGDRIGRYKLLQQIGEGGCGVVFMAEQSEPVRRQVALKVVKLGMDTKSVVARFEAERQALALMDHPNIAKVLDGGATQMGRPYFVMELVRGTKITDYCDHQKLSTEDRLRLFIQVCQAIQHAHQKGIIHRDIKPSNVLVTLRDGVPAPKVIDFGIAKATTDQRLTDKTLFTAFEQFIGTPAYMSPEQAEMSELGIDTRTDIYSLGILLYELLTGRTPFDARELLASGLDAMRQTIRQRDPVRPSTRLSTMLQGELSTTALQRQTEAVKLVHLIRGDLDWIAMKALEKDRSRRYDSATALAADVTRFLNNEPILARPPSNVYRLKKLALRNKLAFAATAAVLLALVAGLAVSTFLYWREKIANERAVVAEAKSRTAALQSDQVAQFLERMIEGVGPEAALGRDTTMMREILQKTEEQMGAELKDQPEVQARLCMSIAGVYDQLNDFAKTEALCQQAIALRRGAVGTNDPVLADWLDNLGMVQQQRGRFAEAEASLRQALEMEKRFMPPNAPPIGLTLLNLAGALRAKGDLPGAEAQIRDTLARARTGPPSDDGARLEGRALNDLGLILWGRGDLPNAASSFQEALTLIKKTHSGDSPESSTTLGNLGLVLWESGKFPEAEAVQRQTLALRIKILGAESNTLVASAYHNLSLVLRDEDRLAEAEADSRRSLEIETNLVGPNHPEAAIARKTLAGILRRRGAAETNAGLLREALHLNPSDGHAVEALAALSANPTMMAPVGAVTPWRYSAIDPGPHWNETAFSDAAWAADPPPRGAPRYLPRSEHTAPPATNLWLRQSLQLTSLPTGDVVFRVGRNHDAELFLNGVVAASVGWSDTARLVPCSAAARAALTPGANVLAMKCNDADGDTPLEATLLLSSEPNPGRREVLGQMNVWLTDNATPDLYLGRANLLAELGQWADAQADFNAAIRLNPTDAGAWFSLTPLLLGTPDPAAYARHCRQALERFAGLPIATPAAQIAIATLLDPPGDSQLESACHFADIAGAGADPDGGLPLRQCAKGLAEYRRGHYPSAIEWLRQAAASARNRRLPGWSIAREKDLVALALGVEAMADFKSLKPSDAQVALNEGAALASLPIPEADRTHLGEDWPERLMAEHLWLQARAMQPQPGR